VLEGETAALVAPYLHRDDYHGDLDLRHHVTHLQLIHPEDHDSFVRRRFGHGLGDGTHSAFNNTPFTELAIYLAHGMMHAWRGWHRVDVVKHSCLV